MMVILAYSRASTPFLATRAGQGTNEGSQYRRHSERYLQIADSTYVADGSQIRILERASTGGFPQE
jgi:hypothetical protein